MPLLQSGDLDSTDVTQHFHCCWVALRQSQQHLLCMTIRQWHMRHTHSHTIVHTHIVIVSPGKHLRKGWDFRHVFFGFFQVASVTFVHFTMHPIIVISFAAIICLHINIMSKKKSVYTDKHIKLPHLLLTLSFPPPPTSVRFTLLFVISPPPFLIQLTC